MRNLESETQSPTSSQKRKMGALASYAYTATQIIVNLLYVPILLHGIGRAEYGLYQMIGSLIAYMTIVNTTLSSGVTRYYCKYYSEADQVGMANTLGTALRIYRWASFIAVIVGVTFMAVLRLVYADALTQWELDEGCLMIGVLVLNLIVTMNNTVSISTITAHEEFVFLKMTMLGTVALQPLAIVALIQWFPYALTVCIVQFFMNCLCRFIQHYYAKSKLGMDTRLRFIDKELQRGLFRFSGGILLAVIADQIFWKTDQLILGYLYGPETVAVYAVGAQIFMVYMSLGTTIGSVFMPRVSQIWQAGERAIHELSDLFVRVGRIALYPLLLVLSGFIVFGQEFIRLWAGEGFSDAYLIAVIIMIPFTVDLAQNIGIIMLQVMDRYYFRARMYLIAALVNIALTVVLARLYGGIGAALATSISIVLSSGVILNIYYARIIGFDMRKYWINVLRASFPITILTVLAFFCWRSFASFTVINWPLLILGIMVYMSLFGIVVLCFSANDSEKDLFKRLLPQRLRKN